jgi:hypothetical protein
MAKEVLIRTLCDIHQTDKDEDVEAQTYVLTFGAGKPPREVDLCPDCSGVMVTLAELLDSYGRPYEGKSEQQPRQQDQDPAGFCPVEGCDFVSGARGEKAARSSVMGHLRSRHDTTLAAAQGLPTPFACPHCDMSFDRAASLAVHAGRVHKAASSAGTPGPG